MTAVSSTHKHTLLRFLSLVIGLPLATLSVMSLVGGVLEPLWLQLTIAGIALIGAPLLIGGKLLPEDVARNENARGLITDVLVVTWMVTATLVMGVGIGWTQPGLIAEAAQLDAGGFSELASVMRWIAGGGSAS